jgi:hypothetical protein
MATTRAAAAQTSAQAAAQPAAAPSSAITSLKALWQQLPQVDETNFPLVSTRIRIIFDAAEAWPLVETGLPANASAEQITLEKLCRAYLASIVPDAHMAQYVIGTTTAKQIWDRLTAAYGQTSAAYQLQLLDELSSLTKLPTETIATYVSRAQAIQQRLALTNHNIGEPQLCQYILRGLPKDYSFTKAIILHGTTATNPLTVQSVHLQLVTREAQLAASSSTQE